jgi:hypothetical protein
LTAENSTFSAQLSELSSQIEIFTKQKSARELLLKECATFQNLVKTQMKEEQTNENENENQTETQNAAPNSNRNQKIQINLTDENDRPPIVDNIRQLDETRVSCRSLSLGPIQIHGQMEIENNISASNPNSNPNSNRSMSISIASNNISNVQMSNSNFVSNPTPNSISSASISISSSCSTSSSSGSCSSQLNWKDIFETK